GRHGQRPGARPGPESPAVGDLPVGQGSAPQVPVLPAPDLRDPLVAAERQLLQVVLQFPFCVDEQALAELPTAGWRAPAHAAVLEGIRSAGGLAAARTLSTQGWATTVAGAARPEAQALVHELAVASLPVTLEAGTGAPPRRYVDSLVDRLREAGLAHQISDSM